MSCDATALTPANASPQVPMARASATDPAAGRPRNGTTMLSRSMRITLARAATATDAASGA
ncbi:MAG: hypothetical protein ACRDNO_15085 [Trebonia sp.]